MKLDSDGLTIILGLMTLIGAIYRLAQVEANINARITRIESSILIEVDKLGDNTTKEIHAIQVDFIILKADYAVRKEWHTETAYGLKQMIAHKFSRLNFHLIDVQRHLEKHSGFIIRSQPALSPEDDPK
ncbi:hypothetical protein FM036_45660 [Nostoc sp. HG1]|nr:hypothetical protein [Nostoc sp. HG1]